MLRHAGRQAIALLTVALAVSSAHAASIRYDLRAVQDGTVGATVHDIKNVDVAAPSGVVKMQLWAIVENANGINEDDGFHFSHLSFLSSAGAPNLLGNLTSEAVGIFETRFSYPGRQDDLDGDGDLDIGTNAVAAANVLAFFVPHAGRPRSLWTDYPSSARLVENINGNDFSSFLIGSLEFAFGSIDSGSASTAINVRPRIRTDGLESARRMHQFTQDGQYFGLAGTDPAVSVGDAVNVTASLTSPVPEPRTLILAATGILGIAAAFRRRRVAKD